MTKPIKKVLIVEDDLSLQPLWLLIIAKCSVTAKVEWAVSSEQALALIRKSETPTAYDLIIADLFLAGSDTGIELLNSKEVKLTGAKKILVSAATRDGLEYNFREYLRDTTIITKPLNVVDCERFINDLTAGSEAI